MLNGTRLLIPFVFVLITGTLAETPLFGQRSFGRPLQRQSGPGLFSQPGSLQGSERFVRGNRDSADFVGLDQTEQQGFVGSEQATGTRAVVSSVAGLQERTDRSSQINRPLEIPAEDAMYHPRIRLDFGFPVQPFTELGQDLTEELAASLCFSERCRFEVSVEGRTAILWGEVTSARERDLAELVVLVEPGISQVMNQLKVPSLRLPPDPEPADRDASATGQIPQTSLGKAE